MVHEIAEVARPVTMVCPHCDGMGEVIMAPAYYGKGAMGRHDPQDEYPVMCGECRGIGEVDLEDED